jgi:hypothetical protein
LVPKLSTLSETLQRIIDEDCWVQFLRDDTRVAEFAFLGHGIATDLFLPSDELAGEILGIYDEVISWASKNT